MIPGGLYTVVVVNGSPALIVTSGENTGWAKNFPIPGKWHNAHAEQHLYAIKLALRSIYLSENPHKTQYVQLLWIPFSPIWI